MVKIELNQKEEKNRITVEVLLNSGVTGFVISLKFIRKHNFKRKKLKRLIYIRNMNSIFNFHPLLISFIKQLHLYYMFNWFLIINVIGDQK